MINIAFSCITAFIITFLAIPSIIKVAVIKNLFDEPGGRKAHKASVPTKNINPRTNLCFEIGYSFRRMTMAKEAATTNWVYAGIRTALFNRYIS